MTDLSDKINSSIRTLLGVRHVDPYPNEHACRLQNPDKYKRKRRVNEDWTIDGKPADIIYGIRRKGGKDVSEVQSIRYRDHIWSESAARADCKNRNGIEFEPAIKEKE